MEIKYCKSYCSSKKKNLGRGDVSRGQRARLQLRRSEFKSCWNLKFFCEFVFKKNENKPIFKNKNFWPICYNL